MPAPSMDLPLPIETSRLRLRPFVPGDLAAYHCVRAREDVHRWLSSEPATEAEAREAIDRRIARAPETGIALVAELAATDAYDVQRVCGRLEARNVASAQVLEKLGMRGEAHFVENEWVKGEWQSELVYELLAREWANASCRRSGGGGAGQPAP